MEAVNATRDREIVSRRLLRAMALLVVSSLVLVTYARVTDRPLEAKPADGPIAQERAIQLFAKVDGSARVLDADGGVIADLGPTEGGFVAGIWRALAFERGKYNIDPGAPVRLVKFEDGRLALLDGMTGERIELIGFGKDNTAAFARFLEK